MHEILAETEKREMTFDHLLTIPEQDEWVYSDGKSTTCVAFILEMYKEAGIFGPISKSIQVTEFTVSTYKPDYSIIEINVFQLLLTVENKEEEFASFFTQAYCREKEICTVHAFICST